ncbi:hypothetical protein [Mesorhizobium sp.]|uniref:hypothetical protein n=1 Tax=Mesorhizobium sp. TaxID=1871066 RepID=UPI0025810AA1|nr:hypothetical protein [Mesorhizobium sp.]
MAGIRQQRQRSRQETAKRLYDHEAGGQAGGDQHAFLVGRAVHMTGAVAVTMPL